MNTPFHMITVGMMNCGKTFYLLKMLEEDYKGHFDYIFIVCPTFKKNKTYQNWKFLGDNSVFSIVCDHDEVEDNLRTIIWFSTDTNSLIILDDCTHQTSISCKAQWSWHHSYHPTANLCHKALQGKYFKAHHILQSS